MTSPGLTWDACPCLLCSGDFEPLPGQPWPGHDRACVIGLSAGTTARRAPAAGQVPGSTAEWRAYMAEAQRRSKAHRAGDHAQCLPSGRCPHARAGAR